MKGELVGQRKERGEGRDAVTDGEGTKDIEVERRKVEGIFVA